MRFMIIKKDEEIKTLADAYDNLSGLGQRLYDELSDDEKARLDDCLEDFDEVTPELVDELLVNCRELLDKNFKKWDGN